jgi:hypothetical protein
MGNLGLGGCLPESHDPAASDHTAFENSTAPPAKTISPDLPAERRTINVKRAADFTSTNPTAQERPSTTGAGGTAAGRQSRDRDASPNPSLSSNQQQQSQHMSSGMIMNNNSTNLSAAGRLISKSPSSSSTTTILATSPNATSATSQKQTTAHKGNVVEAEPVAAEPNYFEDMEPTYVKPKMIVKQPPTQQHTQPAGLVSAVNSNLDSWDDSGEGWDTEDD